MAIEAGLYGISLEKMMIDTLGESIEAADMYSELLTDTHAPDFTLDDFHADLDNIMATTNYTSETIVTPLVTLAAGTLTFDHVDSLYDNGGADDVTVTDAMGQAGITTVSGSATDQLIYMLDFVTAASSTASTFTTQIHANGVFTLDYTP